MVCAKLFLRRHCVRTAEELVQVMLQNGRGIPVFEQLLMCGFRYIEKRRALVPCSMQGAPAGEELCIVLDSRHFDTIERLAHEVAYVLGARILEKKHPHAHDSGEIRHGCLNRFATEWLRTENGSNFAELAVILGDIGAQKDGFFEIRKVR